LGNLNKDKQFQGIAIFFQEESLNS